MTPSHPHDLEALLSLAKKLAALAASIHRQALSHIHVVSTKSSRTDVVTEVDREAERAVVELLTQERPDDAIVAEEGSARDGKTGVRWVIDPLDGSVNYLYGYPAFAVSIGVEIDGRYRVGVVHDSSRDRVYEALEGGGARCDGNPLEVNPVPDLSQALLATGFWYDPELRKWQASLLKEVMPRVRDMRRSGSAAIDLCLLAEGRIDAYYESGLKPWDTAAGGVIAREAGARVALVSPAFGPPPLIVAANPRLYGELLLLLREVGAIDPGVAPEQPW